MLFDTHSFDTHSLGSLFQQKKGAVYSLVLLIGMMVLVVGILSVNAAYVRTVTINPVWAGVAFANQTYNITINNVGGGTISEIRITKPSNFVDIYCLAPVPSGWQCTTNGTRENPNQLYVEFTTGTLTVGNSISFNISSTTASSAGENEFSVRTTDDTNPVNTTSTVVSIDTQPPMLVVMNVSDGTRIRSGANFDGSLFLSNSTGKITFVVNATDNESGIRAGGVRLYYNASNSSDVPIKVDFMSGATYASSFVMSNLSFGPGTLWNATLDGELMLNGTRILFMFVANDTVRTGNVSNYSSTDSSRSYNFTIDAAAPIVGKLNLSVAAGFVSTNAFNTTSVLGSAWEYILNASVSLNVTVNVSDDGGSGVVKAELMNRSGHYIILNLAAGANGSSLQTGWRLPTASNITELAQREGGYNGDGLYNLTFRFTDNVSNALITNFTVEVDDTPPTGVVLGTNITVGGSLSDANLTLDVSTNASFSIRLRTSGNINNNTANVSIVGNKGLFFNMTTESGGTQSGTSFWNMTVSNATLNNLTNFCDISAADASQCNLNFRFQDVLGRLNSTLNLTIAVDAIAPNVSIVSPVAITTNHSATVLINASVNDSVGPLRNVSFRWKNSTVHVGDGPVIEGANVSNWMPLTLTSGTNSQFNVAGFWTATLTISGLADNVNYTIEINATDSAGRSNATANVSSLVFDSRAPSNFTVLSPAANSFQTGMFNITLNVTEIAPGSGLANVSFRIENNSYNWPWVPGSQVVTSNAIIQLFNASKWNLTHLDNEPLNATNGNFTIRFNVTDTAGNQNTTHTVNFTIDAVAPTASFVYPLTNQNQSGNFTINASVTESNINLVQYRWVNDSSKTGLAGVGPWVSMTNVGGSSIWNATFGNLTDGSAFFDGNFSLELNVTDKAGNVYAAAYVTLILDNDVPLVTSPSATLLTDTNRTGDFFVNLTINDTGNWNQPLGLVGGGVSNINGSAFRLENATYNSSWFGMDFETRNLADLDSNRTNATFTFNSVLNGLYNIRFMVNDTAGNINNSVLVNRVMLDNVVPGVALSVQNLSPVPSGGSGVSGTLTFNVSVADNLPVNVSISEGSNISTQGNRFGVFYRFKSASVTTVWLPMGYQTGMTSSAQPHNIVFNASNITTTLADGDYALEINATDSAGNQNATVSVSISIQNSGTGAIVSNHTIQGGFFNGNLVNVSSPTFIVNTSVNSTCLYALDQPSLTTWSLLGGLGGSRAMSNNGSAQQSVALGSLIDKASYSLRYVCRSRDGGNYTSPNDGSVGAATTLGFGVDTRANFNVTIPGKTDNNWPNYFQPASGGSANGWSRFALSTLATDASALASASGGANVTNVLASLLQGTAAGNFTRIYAYNASTNSWASFRVGDTGNTFINFTGQSEFWVNVTAAERLEIN